LPKPGLFGTDDRNDKDNNYDADGLKPTTSNHLFSLWYTIKANDKTIQKNKLRGF
jgi:hypothetical protein